MCSFGVKFKEEFFEGLVSKDVFNGKGHYNLRNKLRDYSRLSIKEIEANTSTFHFIERI